MRRRVRPTLSFFAVVLIALGTLVLATPSPAQDQPARPRPPVPTQRTHARPKAPTTHGKAAPGKKAGAHGTDTRDSHGAHDEGAPPAPVNWWHGLLGKKEGVHPNILWRSPEEPPPFLASVINFALFAFIVVYFGKKPLAAALAKRKESIMREIEDAQLLLAHEIDQMRRDLMKEAVDEASRIATELLAQRMTLADQERFVEAFFLELRSGREQAVGGRPS